MTARVHVNLPALEARGRADRWRAAGLPYARELRRLAAAAARATLAAEDVVAGELSLTFLDDVAIRDVNRAWLGRDRPTDVIAFSLGDGEHDAPMGDVYVGLERAMEQAAERGIEPAEELTRLVVHGTLHVLGHDHPEGETRTRSEMWRRQERLVRELRETA